MNGPWHEGNSVELLENGEEYFPAVFEAIERARHEVWIETFILCDDPVGRQLRERLMDAARRRVRCHLLLDGFGSSELSDEFIGGLAELGVTIHFFDPVKRYFGKSAKMFRRMHRKLVVVDAEVAFCGGINFSQEQLRDFGQLSKQDYSVRLRGPVVREIDEFVRSIPPRRHRGGPAPKRTRHALGLAGNALVRFIVRDNHRNRTQIEKAYLAGIRAARERVVIANAYFFPSYRVLRELRRAKRRNVEVALILQGKPDKSYVMYASRMVYGFLIKNGITVYEYCDRPLHGKVALVDREWATVGSSNLDPLSLSLNLEANVLIRDCGFNEELMANLDRLMSESCSLVDPSTFPRTTLWEFLRSRLVFHFLRHFPAWFDLLPAHSPRVAAVCTPVGAGESQVAAADQVPQDAESGSAVPAPASDSAAPSAPVSR